MVARFALIRRLTVATLIAGLALTAPAARAAGPVPLTAQRTVDPLPVDLAFDGAGRAVASWRTFVGEPGEGEQHHIFAVADRAGRWRSPVTLRGTVLEHDLAVTGRRAAFAVWRQIPAGRRYSRSVIKLIMFDTASGAIRRVHRLAVGTPRRIDPEGTPATLLSPRIAATSNGGFVVTWVRSAPRRRAGVWVATMRSNGRFDAPRRIGPFGGNPMLSIAGDGRGVLAWQRDNRIEARVRRASGTWGAIEIPATMIAAVTWGTDSIDVTAADGWRFAVGVEQTARSIAGVRLYSTVHVRDANGVWRAAVVGDFMFAPDFDTAYVTNLPRVLTFATGDRRLHAGWPALVGAHVSAVAATLAAHDDAVEVTMPVTLSPATTDVALEDAVGTPEGSFAAVWFSGDSVGLTEVDDAGTAHLVTDLATERALRGARVAIDPRSGRALVVWSQGTATLGCRPVAWLG
jgi:hypothetical protein